MTVMIPQGLADVARRVEMVSFDTVRAYARENKRGGATAADLLPMQIVATLSPAVFALASDEPVIRTLMSRALRTPDAPICYAEAMEIVGKGGWMYLELGMRYQMASRHPVEMKRQLPGHYAGEFPGDAPGWPTGARRMGSGIPVLPFFWRTPEAISVAPIVLAHGELSAAAISSIKGFSYRVASLPGATSYNPPVPDSVIAGIHDRALYHDFAGENVIVWPDRE